MRIFGVLALLLAACAGAHGQDAVARMDKVVRYFSGDQKFMGTALVARDGQVVFDRAYGYADLEWDVPHATDSKFRIGSVTKQFTAAAILLLEERGKLKVTDSARKYLTDAPAAWDKITIHHLLSHTAGVPNFTSFASYHELKFHPSPLEKTYAVFRDKPLDFEPGEKWKYSNSGYIALALIVEKASGRKFDDFLKENILTPLGLTNTGADLNALIIHHRASGYTPFGTLMRNAEYIDMTVPVGAGHLYSTTGDLFKWEQALYGGKLLKPESLAKMTTAVKDNYGYGLEIAPVYGHKAMQHGGGIDGFNSYVIWLPETRVASIVLSNVNGRAFQEIAVRLAALGNGDRIVLPAERKEITVAPKALEVYAGTYTLSGGRKIVIAIESGHLVFQPPAGPCVQLFPESETAFFAREPDIQVVFAKDANGTITHLTEYAAGGEIRADRKP